MWLSCSMAVVPVFSHPKSFTMKKLSSAWLFAALLALPLCGFSQTWSKEEQAFLDFYTKNMEKLSDKPVTWESWNAIVQPDDKLTWWITDEGMPRDLNAVKTAHLNAEKQGLVSNYLNFRPIKIIIEGDVAMIWYYEYDSWNDNTGKFNESESKRFLVFKRDGAGWRFLGGMVDSEY